MTDEQLKWKHIIVYQHGARDVQTRLLQLFDRELPDNIKSWLRIGIELADEEIAKAERQMEAA